MADTRPDPDKLLAEVKAAEQSAHKGRLKVFFGAAPGVGKTYTMLEAARSAKREKKDVVIGVVETHGRAETAALTQDLEVLPRKPIEYKGNKLDEFDLQGAIARKPAVLLLDELAHTNAPGSKHEKRWQDVFDLLDAGIDVWTTLNVQHIESLNDIVAQITHVVVRETVPDSVLERADEVEVVDLPPDELLKRLEEGKVYVPTQAKRALQSFFRKGNLLALRELVLRRAAERVNVAVDRYRREEGIKSPWPTRERLLVAVGPSPFSTRLIRATRRMATAMNAPWIALNIETPGSRANDETRGRIDQNLDFAESLGAECASIVGDNVAEDMLAFARARSVTRIIVGKPQYRRWRDIVFGSLLDQLIRKSGDIDIQVMTGDESEEGASRRSLRAPASLGNWGGYVGTFLTVTVCTLLAIAVQGFVAPEDLPMVYLLGVVYIAARHGLVPSVLAALLSVAAFNFFIVPPIFQFVVEDAKYVITFGVMLIVGLTVSALTSRVRRQAVMARAREARTSALYALARELAAETEQSGIAGMAIRRMEELLDGEMAVFAHSENGPRKLAGAAVLDESDLAVARLALERGTPAGADTDNLPSARILALPLKGAGGVVGVAVFLPGKEGMANVRRELLDAFVAQTAMALERAQLAERAQKSHMDAETERLRNALLSSVSHDLRTPLASITGATSTLLDPSTDEASRVELTRTINEEARRMARLVTNLLDMTRLEAGQVRLRKEPVLVEEFVGASLESLKDVLGSRDVKINIPGDVPPVLADLVLMEQVVVNLVENAIKYAPGSPIEISARQTPDGVQVEVADRGPGIPPGTEEKIFDKFYRAPNASGARGAGLGLTICRGVVQAHGNRIWARNRDGGGAVFSFTLEAAPLPPETIASGSSAQ